MRKEKFYEKKGLFTFILITVILLLYQPITSAYSNHGSKTDRLIFLGNNRIPPIIYEQKGIPKGIAVDIAKELGKKIGYTIEIKTIEWNEAQTKILLGEADALLQINPNRERRAL